MTSLDTIFKSTMKRAVTLDWFSRETWTIWFRDSAIVCNKILSEPQGCVGIWPDNDSNAKYRVICATTPPIYKNGILPLCRI